MSWYLPNWLTGYDEANARRAADADAQLRDLNATASTRYGDAWLAQVESDYAAQDAAGAFDVAQQQAAIETAFVEGAAEGLKSTQDRFKGWLSKLGLGVLGFIPWWAWLLALGYVLWKLGALDWLKRRIDRA